MSKIDKVSQKLKDGNALLRSSNQIKGYGGLPNEAIGD